MMMKNARRHKRAFLTLFLFTARMQPIRELDESTMGVQRRLRVSRDSG